MTPNGKIDRKALPAVEEANLVLGTTYVAPETDTEQKVAEIWKQVLGTEQVSIHDNFFALGGHSLLATQVVSQLRVIFQIELPLRKFFETPTIHELAKYLEEQSQMAPTSSQAPAMKRVSRDKHRVKGKNITKGN
ncbi:hypothetical protein KDW_43450 [Dictyobacter vulcani]|uniref:Carrier domain-containing protein n=1 Tax=Dictyobacter vulcani TaxID=2607529 RepID=A0A5J4KRC3_9CHLR|nr:phosphopantetheine-binding protein [Dictyobacter vulcani]GER90183.1 hypothetical protein KDW_43450 [Dictyobacter vulcani]